MGSMKMAKRNSDVGRRAWNFLRLALLWARKGGVFKRRLMTELRLLPKLVKSLGGHAVNAATPRDGIGYRYGYGERQLSFDKTPMFPSVKFNGSSSSMRFLNFPCLNPPVVDFDYEFDRASENDAVSARKSFLSIKAGDDDEEEEEEEEYQNAAFYEELENIDSRAEEFIAKFYEQIKMQSQISNLPYKN